MLHTSLRRLGPVEGGADGVLDAMLGLLGPRGTLLIVLGAEEDVPFDAASTPAHPDMGVLAEIFRRRPGVRVNDHAAARYAAYGCDADRLLEPTRLHDYHGPGSVLDRLTALDGHVLRLGADADTLTLTHWAEYLAEVPNKRRVRRRYERADLGEQWIDSLDDDEGIFGCAEDYFPQVLQDFLSTGLAARGQVGGCYAEYLSARKFIAFATRWIERFAARQAQS